MDKELKEIDEILNYIEMKHKISLYEKEFLELKDSPGLDIIKYVKKKMQLFDYTYRILSSCNPCIINMIGELVNQGKSEFEASKIIANDIITKKGIDHLYNINPPIFF